MINKAFADAVKNIVYSVINDRYSQIPKIYYGVYTAAETVTDLSKVRLTGQSADTRWVPKLKHVVLTANDNVILMKTSSMPLTIIGVPMGDITQAV